MHRDPYTACGAWALYTCACTPLYSLLNVSTEDAIQLLSLARGPAEAEDTIAVTVPLHNGAALGVVLEGGYADDVDDTAGGGGGVYTPIRVRGCGQCAVCVNAWFRVAVRCAGGSTMHQ